MIRAACLKYQVETEANRQVALIDVLGEYGLGKEQRDVILLMVESGTEQAD